MLTFRPEYPEDFDDDKTLERFVKRCRLWEKKLAHIEDDELLLYIKHHIDKILNKRLGKLSREMEEQLNETAN